ncbi:aminoglycoside phosphotransferase family protein [Arthrobacter sp. KBS0702]|uniref:aminoglycoside phosphotransferase family protein n=1 Tax=Arthrobacter sp. KBS0702 TaxID=2578107 RepID=UPI00110D2C44|nr:aminoglycoside phosphotransferase family protein [Arthrobacter sp. KBS0702]QDW29765.1 aminoglycoside phosphotransferase family protein [Arthrobacter sp. KBS0702]
MNTLDADTSTLWMEVERAWPELPWEVAAFRHGAFHHVAVLGSSAVVRVASGSEHTHRTQGEHQNLRTLAAMDLPFRSPVALSEPRSGPTWSAQLTSVVPGDHRTGLSWAEVREALEMVLAGLREAGRPPGALRPVRQACGGGDWPGVVDRILQPLDRAARNAAGRVVANVLDAESTAGTTLVHGDFGLHNIMWTGTQLSGVVDLDNACIGDPAIDLAPLIGAFGSSRVADLADKEMIARARAHRASLPLQVAAAAELVNDSKLRDFALGNFQARFLTGTLEDPSQG